MKSEWNPNIDTNNSDGEVRPEYDFSKLPGGIKGKYAERYHQGTNLVLLEPDVAKVFPTAEAVNEALRLLMKIARDQAKAPSGS